LPGWRFAGYVSEHRYSLIDKRLFIPEQWFTEEYDHRRLNCDLPRDIIFRTKPQLTVETLQTIHEEKTLPFIDLQINFLERHNLVDF
jgi:hypothetical protein